MYSEFAYSGCMQSILAVISVIQSLMIMYLIANLILALYGERARFKQKLLFAFLTGTILNSLWIWGMYFIIGMPQFSQLAYLMLTSANPVFAVLYLFIGAWALKLPFIRSIKLMGNVYIYYVLIKAINRLMASIFFIQLPGPWNYMLDAFQQLACMAVIIALYFLAMYWIRRFNFVIKFSDGMFINTKREILTHAIKATIVYVLVVFLPLSMSETVLANAILVSVFILMLAMSIQSDRLKVAKVDAAQKSVHINALRDGMDGFTNIRHDFYNILQTYGGYMAIGDMEQLKQYHASLVHSATRPGSAMELSNRMNENPALVTLLMSKADYAEERRVKLNFQLQTNLKEFYIENIDLCRVVGCLLDNAIEAAAETSERRVVFSIEPKSGDSKLIIVTNSTHDFVDTAALSIPRLSAKPGHSGQGLVSVRKTLSRYGNCSFNLSYYNYELSAYVEMKLPMTI